METIFQLNIAIKPFMTLLFCIELKKKIIFHPSNKRRTFQVSSLTVSDMRNIGCLYSPKYPTLQILTLNTVHLLVSVVHVLQSLQCCHCRHPLGVAHSHAGPGLLQRGCCLGHRSLSWPFPYIFSSQSSKQVTIYH